MPAIAKGDFTPLLGWLRENVHGRARSASMPQIVQDATGRKLDASAYLAHIHRRYVERAEDA